jgi:hypothetical protein
MAHRSSAHTRARIFLHAHAIQPARAAAIAALLLAGSAAAQTVTPAVALTIDPTAETMPPAQLDFALLDAATPEVSIRSAPLAPPAAWRPATIGSRTYRTDGSMTMSAGERLATPWDANWDAKVGVDLAAPAGPAGAPTPGTAEDRGTGWANVAVPAASVGLDTATIDARVDPNSDQGKLSTALSRAVPIGGSLSLTLQNGYSVTQTLANPNGMPAPRVYTGDGGVKLQFPTATALTAGARMSSIDGVTPALSAEQKLFDTPLSITGTISRLPTGETDRSIMAGFRRTW